MDRLETGLPEPGEDRRQLAALESQEKHPSGLERQKDRGEQALHELPGPLRRHGFDEDAVPRLAWQAQKLEPRFGRLQIHRPTPGAKRRSGIRAPALADPENAGCGLTIEGAKEKFHRVRHGSIVPCRFARRKGRGANRDRPLYAPAAMG